MAVRLVKEVVRDRVRRYWGLNGLDQRLAQLMPYRNGYYVELGANDGRTQSNTLHFERHKGWRGLLVEPSPTAFQHCVMTRSPRNSIVCGVLLIRVATTPETMHSCPAWTTCNNLVSANGCIARAACA